MFQPSDQAAAWPRRRRRSPTSRRADEVGPNVRQREEAPTAGPQGGDTGTGGALGVRALDATVGRLASRVLGLELPQPRGVGPAHAGQILGRQLALDVRRQSLADPLQRSDRVGFAEAGGVLRRQLRRTLLLFLLLPVQSLGVLLADLVVRRQFGLCRAEQAEER